MKSDMTYKFIPYFIFIAFLFSGCSDDDSDSIPGTILNAGGCYNFSTKVAPYDTLINGNQIQMPKADSLYEIDLGFDIQICDSSYSNIYLSGFVYALSYTKDKPPFPFQFDITDYRISPFGYLNLGVKANGSQITSKLLSYTEGQAGSKVTSIEFRDFNFGDSNTSELYDVNCKVIFSEADNSISYHFGPTNTIYSFINEPIKKFLVGVFSPNSSQGSFLSGNPNSPTLISTTDGPQLDQWPANGTYYTFKLE